MSLFFLICGIVVFSTLILHSCALTVILKPPEATVAASVQSSTAVALGSIDHRFRRYCSGGWGTRCACLAYMLACCAYWGSDAELWSHCEDKQP